MTADDRLPPPLLAAQMQARACICAGRGAPAVLEPVTVEQRWGATRWAIVTDPDGNFLELVHVRYRDNGWDTTRRSVVRAGRSFLHYEINTTNEAMFGFYEAPGAVHDAG